MLAGRGHYAPKAPPAMKEQDLPLLFGLPETRIVAPPLCVRLLYPATPMYGTRCFVKDIRPLIEWLVERDLHMHPKTVPAFCASTNAAIEICARATARRTVCYYTNTLAELLQAYAWLTEI
jgi:hypothetical protein